MIEYSNLALRLATAAGGQLRVAVESPAGSATEELTPPESPDLEVLLEAFPAAARNVVRRETAATDPLVDARELGRRLFAALLRGNSLRTYDRSIGALERRRPGEDSSPTGLRLQLFYDPRTPGGARIEAIPWELLCDPLLEDGYLALDPRTPVVRSVLMAQQGGLLSYRPPLSRILVAIATPPGYERLDAEAERQRIEDAWRFEYSIEIEVLADATPDRLRQMCQSAEYQIFHFIGHGDRDPATGESRLAFGDGRGQAQLVGGRHLAGLLKSGWQLPRLAFLNACHSSRTAGAGAHPAVGVALDLLNAGLPAVIGMKSPIADGAAIRLSGKVYRLLGEGLALEEALTLARLEARDLAPRSLDWAIPALYVRGQPGQLFSLRSARYRHQQPPPGDLQDLWGPEAAGAVEGPAPDQPKLLRTLQKKLYALLDDLDLGPGDAGRLSPQASHDIERRLVENLAGLGGPPESLLELGHVNLRFPYRAILHHPELRGGLAELHRKSAIYSSHSLVQLDPLILENDPEATGIAKTGFLETILKLLHANRLLVENGRMSLIPARVQQRGAGLETIFSLERLRPIKVLEDPWSSTLFARQSAAFVVSCHESRTLPTAALLELEETFSGQFAFFQKKFREILDRRWQDDDASSLRRALETVQEQIRELDSRFRSSKATAAAAAPGDGTITVLVDPQEAAVFADAMKGLGDHFRFFKKLDAVPPEIRRSPFFIPWLVHREEMEGP